MLGVAPAEEETDVPFLGAWPFIVKTVERGKSTQFWKTILQATRIVENTFAGKTHLQK